MAKQPAEARRKLTGKQAAFVDEYLIDFNASRAALAAGYSKKTAYRMGSENLQKPQIAEAIQEVGKKVQERNAHTIDDVVADLRAVAKDAMQLVDDEAFKIRRMFNQTAATRALELLGKHYGGLVERRDHTSSDGSMTPSRITRVVVEQDIKDK